jgi:hypothetical protein
VILIEDKGYKGDKNNRENRMNSRKKNNDGDSTKSDGKRIGNSSRCNKRLFNDFLRGS